MTKAPKPRRASLKALWREFRRCSYAYPPLYHDLFCPWPDLSQYGVDDVCKSFRQAFAPKFQDAWEEWHGPADVAFFGRFFGNNEGLDEFKRLAESAYLMVCEIGPDEPNFENFVYPVEHGYHGWPKLLNDMAYGYPTPLLRCEVNYWEVNEQTGIEEEELVRVGTPENGGSPFPLHPFHWRLANSVFTSSMAAIELILDDDRGVLIGDWTWGFPLSFSTSNQEDEVVSANVDDDTCSADDINHESVDEPGRSTASTSDRPELLIDPETFSVSYRGVPCELGNIKEFHLLKRLSRRPGIYVSVSMLIDDVWKDENTDKGTVQKTVSNLRQKLNEAKLTGVKIDGKQKGHYRLLLI